MRASKPPIEQNFRRRTDNQWADPKLRDAVGRKEVDCPYCGGNIWVDQNLVGKITSIRIARQHPCQCSILKNYFSRWENPANVATGYRNIGIKNLEKYSHMFSTFNFDPDNPDAPSSFKTLLETVRGNKYNCYLCVGDAGTGKTALMTAMYNRALLEWASRVYQTGHMVEAVWKVNATSLAKQFRAWELRDVNDENDATPAPIVTVNKILSAIREGFVPCLFLDELDKIKYSDFQLKEFSYVIDAIQANGGQVFACSNDSELKLRRSLGDQYGPAILRRLFGPRLNPDNPDKPADKSKGGFLIDFERGTIKDNYQLPSEVAKRAAIRNQGGDGNTKVQPTAAAARPAAAPTTSVTSGPRTQVPSTAANKKAKTPKPVVSPGGTVSMG
jgi:DNA replication protein DnaC